MNEAKFETYLKCINLIREEEELEGDPPLDLLTKIKTDPVPYLRNAVRLTKERIIKRITEEMNNE
jgi:hypothetical protein